MSDPRDPTPLPAGDGELVSAYLDGELDGDAAAAFEARLASEPALATQLERTREVVEALAGLHATPPEGYAERLRQRVAAEQQTSSLEAARAARGPSDAATAAPVRGRSGGAAVRRGGSGRRRWTPLPAAAAVLALALVGGAAVLVTTGRIGGVADRLAGEGAVEEDAEVADEGMRMFADEPDSAALPEEVTEDEAAVEPDMLDPADDGEAPVGAHGQPDADGPERAPLLAGQPSVVDAGTVLDSEREARDHFSGSGAPERVLGMDLASAEDVASAYRVSIQRADPFPSAVHPDQCLDDILAGAHGPAVPVEVEALTFADGDALAYLVVTAAAGSDRLDRVEGWVVEPDGCATRVFSDVTPGR